MAKIASNDNIPAQGWSALERSSDAAVIAVVSLYLRSVFLTSNDRMITLQNQVEPIDKAIRFFREEKPRQPHSAADGVGKSILTAYVAGYSGDHLYSPTAKQGAAGAELQKYITLCRDFSSNAGILVPPADEGDCPNNVCNHRLNQGSRQNSRLSASPRCSSTRLTCTPVRRTVCWGRSCVRRHYSRAGHNGYRQAADQP